MTRVPVVAKESCQHIRDVKALALITNRDDRADVCQHGSNAERTLRRTLVAPLVCVPKALLDQIAELFEDVV